MCLVQFVDFKQKKKIIALNEVLYNNVKGY